MFLLLILLEHERLFPFLKIEKTLWMIHPTDKSKYGPAKECAENQQTQVKTTLKR